MTDRRTFLGFLAMIPFLGLAAKFCEKRWTAKRKIDGGGDKYWVLADIRMSDAHGIVEMIYFPEPLEGRGMKLTKEQCENLGSHHIFTRA